MLIQPGGAQMQHLGAGVRVSGPVGGPAAIADWWTIAGQTCVAAYQPKGAATLAASYINLANPGTYNAAPGVAPTLDAAGWVWAGGQRLSTGIIPNGANYSIAIRWSNRFGDGVVAGVEAGGRSIYLWPYGPDIYGANGSYIGKTVSGGVLFAAVGVVAGTKMYIDGVVCSGTMDNLGAAYQISIGCATTSTGFAYYFTGKIQALSIYSTTLSASDVAALSARMALL